MRTLVRYLLGLLIFLVAYVVAKAILFGEWPWVTAGRIIEAFS